MTHDDGQQPLAIVHLSDSADQKTQCLVIKALLILILHNIPNGQDQSSFIDCLLLSDKTLNFSLCNYMYDEY